MEVGVRSLPRYVADEGLDHDDPLPMAGWDHTLDHFGPRGDFSPRLNPWRDKKEEGLQPVSRNPCTQMVPKGRFGIIKTGFDQVLILQTKKFQFFGFGPVFGPAPSN